MIPQTPQQAQQAQPQMPPQPQQAMPPQQATFSDPPVTIDAVMRLLRDNVHRRFRIDIEVDSTIASDEAQEKQDRIEFITSITKMVEAWGPIAQAQPAMINLGGQLLIFGARAYRTARALESVIEETVDKLEQMAGLPKPPPQPSPDELMKLKIEQAKGQTEITKAQIAEQTARIDAQAKVQQAQLAAQAAEMDHAHTTQQMNQQAAVDQQKANNEAASNQMKAELETIRFQNALRKQTLGGEDHV